MVFPFSGAALSLRLLPYGLVAALGLALWWLWGARDEALTQLGQAQAQAASAASERASAEAALAALAAETAAERRRWNQSLAEYLAELEAHRRQQEALNHDVETLARTSPAVAAWDDGVLPDDFVCLLGRAAGGAGCDPGAAGAAGPAAGLPDPALSGRTP